MHYVPHCSVIADALLLFIRTAVAAQTYIHIKKRGPNNGKEGGKVANFGGNVIVWATKKGTRPIGLVNHFIAEGFASLLRGFPLPFYWFFSSSSTALSRWRTLVLGYHQNDVKK